MQLEQFLELFNPLPGNHYLEVTTAPDAISVALEDLMQSVDGEFQLALYASEESASNPTLSHTKVQFIHNLKNPFRALPRDNDMILFKDIFSKHENPELLLRIAYRTLANAAHIIIMEKKGLLEIEKLQELLEKFEFRAPNSIDIFPEYDLVMAKKMHMWGNGL